MKKYIKIYLDYFDYKSEKFEDLYIPCENCTQTAVDIHHISPRGRGGSKSKDYIENLMALCRKCHTAAELKQIPHDRLRSIHNDIINRPRFSNGHISMER